MSKRTAAITRKTRETDISIKIDLDGRGVSRCRTRVPFLDHMLDQVARHGLFDLSVTARGDLKVDAHHTVEDVGICLGQALAKALGDKRSINRYGDAVVPMDDALVLAALDISGRPYLSFDLALPKKNVGGFETELVEEFFRALAQNAGLTLHLKTLSGRNTHHLIEAAFKAFTRALSTAVARNPRVSGVPSTKGRL